MADEIRRSGRATKGQHNKDREGANGAPKQKGKAKGKKAKAEPEPEPEEEDEELIRCVCGLYEEEEDKPRSMICCDKCSAWQHNDCMGLPEDYAPEKYYCEQCRPQDHKELIAAIKRGEKPWEDRAVERERLKAEKEVKKKGKKAGRKSGARASDAQRTPTLEPEESVSSKKRKHEESPAPETKASESTSYAHHVLISPQAKKARSSLRVEAEAQPEEEAVEEPSEQNPILADVAKDAKDIANPTRSKIASNIVKSFIEQANGLVQSGAISPSKGETPKSLGTRIALQVEHAVYHIRSGAEGEPSDAYRDQIRTILNNIKSNADLAARLMNNELPADKLAAMEPKDMATDAQKQKDAEEKLKMDKQHVLVEEQGPRIRKTHKGEEYVDESHQVAESATSKPPAKRQSTMDQGAEMKSPPTAGSAEKPQAMRKQSAAGKGKPFGDPRRKSSSNFDINKVWSGVQGQGSPTDGDAPRLPEGQSRGSPPPLAGTSADADPEVDRLLKDEDNESAPYSPKDFVEEGVVWRGKVNGGSLGTFNTVAKFAAGCQPEVENLSMTWSEVIPQEIKLHGRIQPSKADEYLCGLEYSNTTELVIVSLAEPKDPEDQVQFSKFFNYLKAKGRYGVGSQHSVPAIKDIYLLPMEVGQPLPTVMRALEHVFADPVTERSFLVPIVIKWTELPHNAERARQQQREQQAVQSPSIGPPVAQTPITPHEPQMQFDPRPSQPQQTQTMNGGGHPTPTPAQFSTPPPQQQAQVPVAHAPVQAPIPQNPSPAAINALRILGPEMAACPAVTDLIAQAPNAGENEFNIIKECIEENAEAGKSLGVLTVMLQQKYQSQRSSREQAASQNQTPVAAHT
ncbi:Transcription factor bye1 [Knufia fluminis]|uniref:Transcription factor BYE1 n=1 Tax=Knufia fluminis TaxID=191047 RepID=A0AAN8I1T2_9EURO|nr:Transcription factor bye1 [Knufia fluminis]